MINIARSRKLVGLDNTSVKDVEVSKETLITLLYIKGTLQGAFLASLLSKEYPRESKILRNDALKGFADANKFLKSLGGKFEGNSTGEYVLNAKMKMVFLKMKEEEVIVLMVIAYMAVEYDSVLEAAW
ncbi:hypothetical protein LXL04_033591 [Taraxacum kok-saghyz]